MDWSNIETPAYVCDEDALRGNLEILARVRERTGCTILLALKAFAMFAAFPLVQQFLQGTCASSPYEARLGAEEFGGQVHVCAPAYSDRDMTELVRYADCIVFNSFAQWHRFAEVLAAAPRKIMAGLRFNPEYSEVEVDLYNPCAAHSRLGIRRDQFTGQNLDGISGLHFHTLCEQGADVLKRTLAVVEQKAGQIIRHLEWVNFGGGHHITRAGYDVDALCEAIVEFKQRYSVDVILEPGEAVALDTGVLVSTVLDVVNNGMQVAVLDTSAEAHMPDVLAMPYRPEVAGAARPGEKPHTYRLAGITCLAGDVIGDYSFDEPLAVGDRVVFLDMAHYTMVKNTMFNGIQLPSIALCRAPEGEPGIVRLFRYEDYKRRLS